MINKISMIVILKFVTKLIIVMHMIASYMTIIIG